MMMREGGIIQHDRGQLTYFRHLATGLPGVDVTTLSEPDLEALARHHGLCSNLLDWTESPFVAAFFAFIGAMDRANDGRLMSGVLGITPVRFPEEPICIWRMNAGTEIWINGEFVRLESLNSVNFWQKAQRGLFTRLTHNEHRDIAAYLEQRNMKEQLHRLVIPGGEAGKALHDLENMNITFATLFPDLRGAALQANIGPTWRFLSGVAS